MSTSKAPDYKASLNQLESIFDEYLGKKAPEMPENIKETLVSFAPYLAIVGLIFSVSTVLPILGIGALMGPFSALLGASYMMSYGIGYYLGIVCFVIVAIFEGLAISGLFKRSMGAWRLMYYSSLVSFVASVLQGSFGGAIIGGLIGLYILFQVKNKYK
ncbi:MAG: hypothetical protein NTZ55_02640 [Candidatus Roizmanbacteria bacterium]|nr:hypothetical protein [Candidatus Roizmanbacteria bacterium]